MPKNIICCGEPVAQASSVSTGVFTIACKKCGRTGAGSDADKARADFEKGEGTAAVLALPSGASQLPRYLSARMDALHDIAIPFIANDRKALTRLVKNNIRYVMIQKDANFAKCWQTPEGQESIVHALEEALSLGAELGKTGSLVPFGGVIEFIPAVEAYEFALTNGSNPPFAWIQIDTIHENDIIKNLGRVNGVFTCEIVQNIPRGELRAIVVYGYNNKLRHVIGESYDVERLLGKAEQHSASYKYYLRSKNGFERARTEGNVHVDAEGRMYAEVKVASDPESNPYFERDLETFEKAEADGKLKKNSKGEYAETEVPKKDGTTWKKKIYRSDLDGSTTKRVYEDDITNPYEGPDQPEMLRKAAGKSFLGKYARVRNSEAAIDELADEVAPEKMVDAVIDKAFETFDVDHADIVVTPIEPEPEPAPEAEAPTDAELAAELHAEDESPQAPTDPDSLMGKVKAKVGENKEKDAGEKEPKLF